MTPEETAAPFFSNDDDQVGELIPKPTLTPFDTEISVGDLVHFRVRHPAFAGRRAWPELLGFVRAVRGGHDVCYLVEVCRDEGPRWHRLVPRADVLMAWVDDGAYRG